MLKYLYSLIVVFTLFASCNKSDDDAVSGGEAIFRATINGELWETNNFSQTNGLYQVSQSNEQLFQLQGDSDGIRLRVVLTTDGISDCMPVRDYDFPDRVGINYDNGEGTGNFIGGHFYDVDDEGSFIMTLRVTSCSNNKISGEFSGSYTGDSGPNSPTNIEITNGLFENIEFETFQQ